MLLRKLGLLARKFLILVFFAQWSCKILYAELLKKMGANLIFITDFSAEVLNRFKG